MADATIAIADCTVTLLSPLSGMNFWSIVTPSTADKGDKVDTSTVVLAGSMYQVKIAAETDGLLQGTATAAGVVYLNGTTADEARTIYILGRSA